MREQNIELKEQRASSAPRERFFNREWSWLRFNERVLAEAEDARNPLLERVKFAAIFAANLDEFFMIRVAGLYRQLEARIGSSGPDQRSPREQIDGIAALAHALCSRQERVVSGLFEQLARNGIKVVDTSRLEEAERAYLTRYYNEVIYPVISPTIVRPKQPLPALQAGALCLVLRLADNRRWVLSARAGAKKRRQCVFGLVVVPRVLPRFVRFKRSDNTQVFVPIEAILVSELPRLFAGYERLSVGAIRLTRDADIALDEEASEDMRRALAKKLLGRRHGAVVRMEYGQRLDGKLLRFFQESFDLEVQQLYPWAGLMQLGDLMSIRELAARPDLEFEPLRPLVESARPGSIFDWIGQQSHLLHHPYHSFDPVAELVSEAADDPDVLAIKQTLYRTSGNSPIVQALTRAAERGKHVTAVVELRARFDEERNIEWARRLEQAGAHVVYGLVGLKTHCKALLVVRREHDGIRRYVHLGTGNYNDATARAYTDMGLLSADDLMAEDVSALFNVLSGATEPPLWNKVEMAPTGMRRRLLHLIRREADKSNRRARGRIVAKMNSLVDEEVIDALYQASRAGVRVDLIVRGICCLRPGVDGLSDNIRVRSIVGRFLEHPRVLWLRNGGVEEVYLSSADWMPRNLDHRIELMFPVEDPRQREYIKQVLELQLEGNVKSSELRPDGSYLRLPVRGRVSDSQLATYAYSRSLVDGEPPRLRRFLPLAQGGAGER